MDRFTASIPLHDKHGTRHLERICLCWCESTRNLKGATNQTMGSKNAANNMSGIDANGALVLWALPAETSRAASAEFGTDVREKALSRFESTRV